MTLMMEAGVVPPAIWVLPQLRYCWRTTFSGDCTLLTCLLFTACGGRALFIGQIPSKVEDKQPKNEFANSIVNCGSTPRLADEIDAMHEKFRKPLIMTEFGADTIAGDHAQPPEMFSEEYQVELLTRYPEPFKTRPFVVGEHIWNLSISRPAKPCIAWVA